MSGKHPFPQQLEEVLNRKNLGLKFSVFNLGSPENTSSIIVENLEYVLRTYKPNMVIVLMGERGEPGSKPSRQKASFL